MRFPTWRKGLSTVLSAAERVWTRAVLSVTLATTGLAVPSATQAQPAPPRVTPYASKFVLTQTTEKQQSDKDKKKGGKAKDDKAKDKDAQAKDDKDKDKSADPASPPKSHSSHSSHASHASHASHSSHSSHRSAGWV
jgi:hypothetical protein